MPATDEWWLRNVQLGIISAGHEGKPGDDGEVALRSFNKGDWIFAFAKGIGYVGAGIAEGQDTYRLVQDSDIPAGFETNHRHWRTVNWRYVIPSLMEAVTWQDAGRMPPPKTGQIILDKVIAKGVLDAIARRVQHVVARLGKISSDNSQYSSNLEREDDEVGLGQEDLTKLRVHKSIERNRKLAQRAKKLLGYRCVACKLDFQEKYGGLGKGFIEAHHLTPLSELKGQIVMLDPKKDFTVLCSNCHRMIHRSDFVGNVAGFVNTHVLRNEA